MLSELPGEQERRDLLLGGSAVGDHLQVRRVYGNVLVGLDEHPALDLLHLVLPVLLGRAYGGLGPEEAYVLLGLHYLRRALLVVGADDGLHEVLGDLLGGGHVAVPVQADDASERRERIHVVGGDESVVDAVGRRQPARVGVLHDDRGGLLEVHADVQGLVQVEDVVVGELLAMDLLRLGDRGARGERVLVERCGLVGVLPVPEVLHLLQRDWERRGEPFAEVGVHAGRYHGVVVGGGHEGLGHEPPQELLGKLSGLLQLVEYVVVLAGRGDDSDGLPVLRRGADHAGAADVYVLYDVLEGGALFQDGLLERIEVYDHHVYGLYPFVRYGLHVLRYVPASEDACMDARMERLYAAVEHLGEPGHIGHLGDADAVLFQKPVCPACGDYFDSERGEGPCEVHDPILVGNADYRSANFRQ